MRGKKGNFAIPSAVPRGVAKAEAEAHGHILREVLPVGTHKQQPQPGSSWDQELVGRLKESLLLLRASSVGWGLCPGLCEELAAGGTMLDPSLELGPGSLVVGLVPAGGGSCTSLNQPNPAAPRGPAHR